MKLAVRVFDLLQGPRVFQFFWHMITSVSPMTDAELKAVKLVLGEDAVRYQSVRVAQGRILKLFFRFNRCRAFTLFRTINLPDTGYHARGHFDLLVHEMVHVRQFELVGSVYIPEALQAQRTEGYDYGGWPKLAEAREQGKNLACFNREQQGQIAQDYYTHVVEVGLSPSDPRRLAFEPLIDDLRAGRL